MTTREWNAEAYHRVSDPQFSWGLALLSRLPLTGDELVLDVGCGTGRLTERLVERLPSGRVVAIDVSANMLTTARAHLQPRLGPKVAFVRADAAALPLDGVADAIFSAATFHWIHDHAALFASLHRVLKRGGVLVAQCGGGPNLQRIHDRCVELMQEPRFSAHFRRWDDPWEFADAEGTAQRLAGAGFVDIRTDLQPSPVVMPDAAAYAAFIETVVCRTHIASIPSPAERAAFIGTLTTRAAGDARPFELDYWRLNIHARRPR